MWVSGEIKFEGHADWDGANPMCAIADDAGGIVLRARDVGHVAFLPGFVTTTRMTRPQVKWARS